MAKGDRWSDDPDVKVREMRNAETVLGVIVHRPLASRLRSKDLAIVLSSAARAVAARATCELWTVTLATCLVQICS